jgi:HD-GYP domain-containing protein (c-di-GMP phosphodiesterase class II)
MGLDETELLDLGLGAMFHDLGKALIPDEILNKPDRLTEQEFAVMKTHPTLGVRLLEEQGADLSPPVFGVIRHHHERLDGSGYPDGLRESELHHQACICGLADVYDALTSRRVYKPGMPPHEALKVIFKLRDSHFPRARLDRFIQCLGIYPVGTVIRLTTGEVALVMDINHASLQRPRVRVCAPRAAQRRPSPSPGTWPNHPCPTVKSPEWSIPCGPA